MATGREDNATHLFYTKPASVQAKEAYALDFSKYAKKNFISAPANKYEDSVKQHITTLPAYIIQDLSMYWALFKMPAYMKLFFSDNEKYAYRNGVILERDGEWFPEVAGAVPAPEQPITTPKAFYPSVYSEKHGEETIWIRTIIDYHKFDYAERYYELSHWVNFVTSIARKIVGAEIRFISALINSWIYGVTSKAVLFEKSSDDQIFWQPTGKDISPEESFSKLANKFYKEDGEIKKQLKKIVGWAQEKHKNKVLYDPINLSRPIGIPTGQPADAEFQEEFKIPDLSTADKVKTYIKSTYYKDFQNNKQIPAQIDRGSSVIALVSTILSTVNRFTRFTPLQTNTFAYDLDNSTKTDDDKKKADIQKTRCDGRDLIVLMNEDDRQFADRLHVSTVTPITNNSSGNAAGLMGEIRGKGVTIVDCPILLPGWSIVCDRKAFHVYRYYNAIFEEHRAYWLIRSHIGHSMFRPVMFSQVCGAAVLPVTKNSFAADNGFYDRMKTFGFLSQA